MTHSLAWLIPNHLVKLSLSGGISPEEIQEASNAIYKMIMDLEADHLVHLMVDAQHAHLSSTIHKYASLSFERAPNSGWTLTIGNMKILGLISSILSKLAKTPYTYFNSIEEALEFLRQRDLAVDEYLKDHPYVPVKP